jgi:predicted peptidase
MEPVEWNRSGAPVARRVPRARPAARKAWTVRHIPRLIACACALLAGCLHMERQRERVSGVAPLAQDAVAAAEAGQFDSGNFVAANGTVLPYRLLPPSRPELGARYPLVLQLHGSGGIGSDNLGQLDRLVKSWAMPDVRERYQAYVLAPQFPVRSANYGPASPDQKSEPSAALSAAIELVRDFASKNPVDPGRIYAVGFSMGGSAAWLAPVLDPSLFAAIVPIAGIAPPDSDSPAFRRLPVLILHGNADDENPITADERFFAAINAAGGRRVRFREYDGLAHRLPSDVYPGRWWRDWLFRQER